MSALRPHIRAARAYEAAARAKAETSNSTSWIDLADLHRRAAEIMEAEEAAEYAAVEFTPFKALQRQLRVAEREVDQARSAHDSSSFHGRERTARALAEVERLRAEIGRRTGGEER